MTSTTTPYGQYCPIARTAEILAVRWTPLIVRNLLFGATSFTDLSHGVPSMSRSVLSARLRSLERWGVIVKRPTRQGSRYLLTEAGYDLATTIAAMAEWGERWLETTSDHTDAAFALWAWVRVQMDGEQLPAHRTVVEFDFVDAPPGRRAWWLLIDHGSAEMCDHDPGGDHRVWVSAQSEPFCQWHRGVRSWAAVTGGGEVVVTGPADLVRALPRWNTHHPTLPPREAVCDGNDAWSDLPGR